MKTVTIISLIIAGMIAVTVAAPQGSPVTPPTTKTPLSNKPPPPTKSPPPTKPPHHNHHHHHPHHPHHPDHPTTAAPLSATDILIIALSNMAKELAETRNKSTVNSPLGGGVVLTGISNSHAIANIDGDDAHKHGSHHGHGGSQKHKHDSY